MVRRGVAAAVVSMVVIAGCGGDGGSEATGVEDQPDESVVAPVEAGAEVAEGFTVVEGSVPIGPALPIGIAYSDVVDDGWTASFLVTGDLVEVVEGYLAQGVAAGLT